MSKLNKEEIIKIAALMIHASKLDEANSLHKI